MTECTSITHSRFFTPFQCMPSLVRKKAGSKTARSAFSISSALTPGRTCENMLLGATARCCRRLRCFHSIHHRGNTRRRSSHTGSSQGSVQCRCCGLHVRSEPSRLFLQLQHAVNLGDVPRPSSGRHVLRRSLVARRCSRAGTQGRAQARSKRAQRLCVGEWRRHYCCCTCTRARTRTCTRRSRPGSS